MAINPQVGVLVTLTGVDPAAVEEVAREIKARFGKKFEVTRRTRSRKSFGLTVRGVIVTDAGDGADADLGNLLKLPFTP